MIKCMCYMFVEGKVQKQRKSHILGMARSRWNSVLDGNLLRTGTSLAAQGLGHLAFTAEGEGLNPWSGN